MKGFKVFLMLAMLIASAITTLSAIPDEEESFFSEENNAMDETKNQLGKSTSLRSRFLASRPPAITCDKYPKLCQVSAAQGRIAATRNVWTETQTQQTAASVGGMQLRRDLLRR
ncbi:hypothetical protein Prudu_010770 [Prunus dulcis]|uniref:Uncharacterized protein n=1 Tax=Prunus dulcis TaxID=3755 RepID=A0A4Y1R9A2_PRUDU|nr:hypothetical protein Prudu_010770 [Prunus dulcis]